MAKQKEKIEFRYYEIPEKELLLALLGENWMRGYGLNYLHFHNYLEIGVCYYGNGEVVIEDRHYPVYDTPVTIIPPNVPHDTRTVDDKNYWEWLYIDVETILKGMYSDDAILAREIKDEVYANAFFFQQSDQPGLMNILNTIIKEAREKKYMYRESLKGLLSTFVVELLRINRCARDLKRKEKKSLIIAPAIDYVEKHYRDDIKISTMAETCNLSESHFRKTFGECMGTTPLDFLNLTRIQKACELLSRTDYSIANISYQIGYSNVSTFMRNFRKVLGVTPYQWKKSADNYEGKLLNYKVSAQKGWQYN